MRESESFESNLAALRRQDLALAQLLESVPLPPAAKPTPTRDGRISFSWGTPDAPQWLGGTSVPSARARGLLDNFQAGSGNVLFIGIGAGTEAAELLARTPHTTALFVIEPDPAAVVMVLRVVDLSAALAAQRLVLMVGEDGWSRLQQFLTANPGFLAPQRVLAWPWLTRDAQHDVASRLTTLAANISAARETPAQRNTASAPRTGQAIAIVSLSPDPQDSHLAAGIAWGVEQLARSAKIFCADAPARMHPAALTQFLSDPALAEAIFLNATAADLAQFTPAPLPVRTWLTPNFPVAADFAARVGDHASIIVSTSAQQDMLISAGVSPRQITLAPPAAHPTPTTRRKPLLVLAPNADDRPESSGLHLTTHLALWNAARQIIAQQAEQLWADDIPAAFAQAEKNSSVRISDPAVRQGLLDRVQNALAPAILRGAFVEILRAAEIDFDLVPTGQLPGSTTAYAAVLQLSLAGEPTCEFLDAIANGAQPTIRTRQGRLPPAIAPYLPTACLTPIASADELIACVRRLANAPTPAAARDHILKYHTWRERLRDVLKKTA